MSDAEEKLLELRHLIRLIVNERISDLDLREDAEQEAMLAAWERLAGGRSHGIAVHAAKQAAIDVGRGRRMTGSKSGKVITKTTPLTRAGEAGEEYIVEPVDETAEAAFEAIDARASLETLLAPLDDEQRSLVLRHLSGETTRQIAPSLGISHQAVSGRVIKALTVLRQSLG